MVILYILLGLLFLYIIISFIIFYVTCHKGTIKQIQTGLKEATKPFESIHEDGMKHYLSLAKEDLYISSFDNLSLHAELVRCKDAQGTMILVHGYKSNALNDLALCVRDYLDLNLNVLMLDNRTSGLSSGKYTTFGVLEAKDLVAWVMYAKKLLNVPVAIGGVSMGASSVLFATPQLKGKIAFAVADSPFIEPYSQILYTIDNFTILKGKPFMPLVNEYSKRFAKFNMKTSVLDKLNTVKTPILFIHGKADTFVPVINTLDMYEEYKGQKDLLISEKAGHGMAYYYDKEDYLKKLKKFVKSYMK